jgi:hypothetical protein
MRITTSTPSVPRASRARPARSAVGSPGSTTADDGLASNVWTTWGDWTTAGEVPREPEDARAGAAEELRPQRIAFRREGSHAVRGAVPELVLQADQFVPAAPGEGSSGPPGTYLKSSTMKTAAWGESMTAVPALDSAFATAPRLRHAKFRRFARAEQDGVFGGFRSCAL